MSKTITLALRAEDAEQILRDAAYKAAKYSSLCDYVTHKTVDSPKGYGEPLEDVKEAMAGILHLGQAHRGSVRP